MWRKNTSGNSACSADYTFTISLNPRRFISAQRGKAFGGIASWLPWEKLSFVGNV